MTAAGDAGHAPPEAARLAVLDGWRAVSILLVLAAHMLPLGPKAWGVNAAAGGAGMALFFTLSGFLITTGLARHPEAGPFLVRRLCRILPLAYLAVVIYMLAQSEGPGFYASHFLFLENYDHAHLTPLTAHFWSLCVEVHFYALVAALALLSGRRGLLVLPPLALAVTAIRVQGHVHTNIKTHLRADEILAGAALALVRLDALGGAGRRVASAVRAVPLWAWLPLLAAACDDALPALPYLRPYLAAATVGHTLLAPGPGRTWLEGRALRYVAEVSYALYVIHPLTTAGWLGSGGVAARYAKRALSFALTFGLAHLSTFYYERPFIAWGKRIGRRLEMGHPAQVAGAPAPGG